MEFQEKTYRVNEVTLHTKEAGPADGTLMLFLHGFPEFWYGWKNQLAYFAANGFRVIAPDQRGYNQSSKPEGKTAYHLDFLATDIAELIRQVTGNNVILVGHDWGGAVAWTVADRYPELLQKLIILNMPHPAVMKSFLKGHPKQMVKSWYAGFFQLPWLPETVCKAFNYKILELSMTTSAAKNAFSPEDLKHYKTAWNQPGALKAMLNWYRANPVGKLQMSESIEVPTLLLWGKKDTFLSEEMALPSIEKCTNGQLIFLKDASHWLHHENPELVNRFMFNFVKG
jgi:epoxide hydrolase 4